ncbi:MAG: hypothetical protein K8S62_09335 [Candidatus Sabulitectum sp.]|nr:hypothetical protein [Candidatus Sabulitectum sp.]
MKSFIFTKKSTVFPEICGTTVVKDLITHLRNFGVTHIFSDTIEDCDGVITCNFESAKQHLGTCWLAAYGGCITRQSPAELRDLALTSNADVAVSLSCSSKPWEHTTILTDGKGIIEKIENNPPPENTETNLCFSGLAWVATDDFDPREPLERERTSAFLLSGCWKCPDNRENYLLTIHDIMRREIFPWPHLHIPDNGIITRSSIPAGTEINGTLWVGTNCLIENGCTLENCVLLDGSSIAKNSNLRNCLVMAGGNIPRNTLQYDKYLSLAGDDNGREH